MTVSTIIGALTPGIISIGNSGTTSMVTSSAVDNILMSTGPNTYAFSPSVGTSSSGNVAQIVSANPTTTNFVPPVGGSVTYTLASEFLALNVTPTSASSTYYVEFAVTVFQVGTVTTGSIVGIAGYLNAGGTRIIFNQSNDAAVQNFTAPVCSSMTFSTGSLTPFTFNFCAQNSQVSSTTAISPFDFCAITEINPINSVASNPVVVSTSATPVTSFVLPSPPTGTSVMYNGYQSFVDTANILTNMATFTLVLQQPGNPATTAPTIAYSDVLYDAVWASPTLTFTTAIGGLTAQIVGVNGSTFLCQNSYTSVSS